MLKAGLHIAGITPNVSDQRYTFAEPHQYATGVRLVFVNGQAVLLDGAVTGARPGRTLRSSHR